MAAARNFEYTVNRVSLVVLRAVDMAAAAAHLFNLRDLTFEIDFFWPVPLRLFDNFPEHKEYRSQEDHEEAEHKCMTISARQSYGEDNRAPFAAC